MSVTKAGGLSDAPGAERSPNGKDGDTVTYVNISMTLLHFAPVQLTLFGEKD